MFKKRTAAEMHCYKIKVISEMYMKVYYLGQTNVPL